jgi:lysophospholipase L1-like esterase
MVDLPFQGGEKVLFIGDSITDCGRSGLAPPLGDGYVSLFVDLVTGLYPERRVSWINRGIDGNRVSDLQARWEDDVVREDPDWLLVLIGINDLHSHRFGGWPDNEGVSPERFRTGYDEILVRTKQKTRARLILISPFYISLEQDPASPGGRVLELLPRYINIVREMSQIHGAQFINLQEMFERQLRFRPAETFCPEPVHPNRTGHLLIAQKLLTELTA